MTPLPRQGDDPEIFTAKGPWRFARERVVDGHPADALYALYRRAFNPLKTRAAARQVLTHQEFLVQMADRRIDKYLAFETGDDPVGIVTMTRDLAAVPWVSPEYYAVRYPDQWERRAILYLGFILIRPGVRRTGFLETITEMLVEPLVAEKAVLVYDVCSFNDEVLGFSSLIAQTFQRFARAEPKAIDAQVYYAMEFA